MDTKFVVRVLDSENNLLSWAEVWATPRPQARGASCPFFPVAPTQFVVEREGDASKITVHWCDCDIAREQNLLAPTHVALGQVFNFTWLEPIWLVSGMHNVPLPAVTVRAPVSLAPPAGNLAAVL